MAIQTKREKLQILAMIFQARYTDGFRLIDRMGEVLNHVSRELPDWKIIRFSNSLINIRHFSLPIKANIGHEAVDLTWEGKQESADAEKNCEVFAQGCELFYELVTTRLNLDRTTRIGIRYHILAPAESIEEADKATCSVARSSFQQAVSTWLNMEMTEGVAHMLLEDPNTGLRRSVTMNSAVTETPPGAPPILGFPTEPGQGSGGLLLDIDTFMRPPSGHVGKVSVFVQEHLLQAMRFAPQAFLWSVQN